MAARGIQSEVDVLSRVGERGKQLHGVLRMHVVVHHRVDEEQVPREPVGALDGRALVVARDIVAEQSHVALGVDRVVQPPVGDRRVGDPHFEDVRIRQDRVDHAVAAVARPHDGDAAAVGPGLRREIARRLGEVVALPAAEVQVDDLHEGAAVVVRAPVVQADDDVALLRQPLREAAGRELVVHLLRAGPAIDREDHGVALRRVEGERLDEGAVEAHRVGRGEAEQLDGGVGVGREPLGHARVVLELLEHAAAPGGGPQLHLPRLIGRRPTVEVVARVRRHVDRVGAAGRREAARPAAVEADDRELALQRRGLCSRVVDRPRLGIDSFDARHAPAAAGHLVHEPTRIVVAVDVLPAVAVREPEELRRPHRERHEVVDAGVEVVDVDPGARAVAHDEALAPRPHVEEVEAHHVLRAIERDQGQRVGPAGPVQARHVVLAALPGVEPDAPPRAHVHHADFHGGVGVAGLGMRIRVQSGCRPSKSLSWIVGSALSSSRQ